MIAVREKQSRVATVERSSNTSLFNCPDLSYDRCIGEVQSNLKKKSELEKKLKHLTERLIASQDEYIKLSDAQKLLSTVSDDNTTKTLGFITQMVNKTLQEVFFGRYSIKLSYKLYAGSRMHIKVILIYEPTGMVYKSMSLQSGYGISQVISFMYSLCLIEIRKGRRLLIVDERLNGLHQESKRVIAEIIKIFSQEGFQFIFVEYTLNNLGKIYNIESRGDNSVLVDMEGRPYTDDIIKVSDISEKSPDLSILDENYAEEEDEEES